MGNRFLEENKENIFTKFVNFIKRIFGKETIKQISAPAESVESVEAVEAKEPTRNFADEIRIPQKPTENPKDSKLLNLQSQFENNEIDLCVMSNEEIHDLNSLYKTQISDLKMKLKEKKSQINALQKRVNSYSTNV